MAASWPVKSSIFKLPKPATHFVSEVIDNDSTEKKKALLLCWRDVLAWSLNRTNDERSFSIDSIDFGFFGQKHALKEIGRLLKNRLGGWTSPKKPLTIVFLGPSGTGDNVGVFFLKWKFLWQARQYWHKEWRV